MNLRITYQWNGKDIIKGQMEIYLKMKAQRLKNVKEDCPCWTDYCLANLCYKWDHNTTKHGCDTCGIYNHKKEITCEQCRRPR